METKKLTTIKEIEKWSLNKRVIIINTTIDTIANLYNTVDGDAHYLIVTEDDYSFEVCTNVIFSDIVDGLILAKKGQSAQLFLIEDSRGKFRISVLNIEQRKLKNLKSEHPFFK